MSGSNDVIPTEVRRTQPVTLGPNFFNNQWLMANLYDKHTDIYTCITWYIKMYDVCIDNSTAQYNQEWFSGLRHCTINVITFMYT